VASVVVATVPVVVAASSSVVVVASLSDGAIEGASMMTVRVLQNLNDQFRDCIERAGCAEATRNPGDRQDWLALEGRYLALARGIQFAGRPGVDSMDEVDSFVAKLNIAHYKRLLVTETDAAKLVIISGLLTEEQAKLAKILKERRV
jgi:hypothetical protein